MSRSCPKGYYWDGTKCRKSIVIKRHGIYGKGFESESQQQQEAKIRQVEKIEPPTLVDEQMAALNAFTAHSSPEVHRKIQNDLKYAEKFERDRSIREINGGRRCPPGYHLVLDHFRNRKGDRSMVLEEEGVYVKEYCAKNPRRR